MPQHFVGDVCVGRAGTSVRIGISRNQRKVCTSRHSENAGRGDAIILHTVTHYKYVYVSYGSNSCCGHSGVTLSDTMTSGRPQQANRLTRIFLQMKETCPQHLQAYAACVVAQQKEGSLDHKSCETEFSRVKSCFRSVRRVGR
jgi:hypothetical protein